MSRLRGKARVAGGASAAGTPLAAADVAGEMVDSAASAQDATDSQAVLWRTTLQVAIRFRETPPELAGELWRGLRGRLWSRLTKPDGTKYREFREFCEAPQPHGLGTAHAQVNRLLVEIGNAREVKLLTVAPGSQGHRRDPASASRQCGGKPSSRTTERLRAIAERSPEAIQRLYTAGVIDQIDAEPFGRRRLPPERQAEIADFVKRVAAPLAKRMEEDGWVPPPGERGELRRRIKSEIGAVFTMRRPRATPLAGAAAGARSLQPTPPAGSSEQPPRAAQPLSAEQIAGLSLAELIGCHWLVVRELFGKRLAALSEEHWIDEELHPKALCRRDADGELELQQTIARIELALEAANQGQPVSVERVRQETSAPPAKLARIWTRPAPTEARRGVTRSS